MGLRGLKRLVEICMSSAAVHAIQTSNDVLATYRSQKQQLEGVTLRNSA